MKTFKSLCLILAIICSVQLVQAQSVTLHSSYNCSVQVDISWSTTALGCVAGPTTSSTLTQRCQTVTVNAPVSGAQVIDFTVTYSGAGPIFVNLDPCAGGPQSGNTMSPLCTGGVGNLEWDDLGTGSLVGIGLH